MPLKAPEHPSVWRQRHGYGNGGNLEQLRDATLALNVHPVENPLRQLGPD
ncbi:MAG: hypothetical protein AAB074_00105 [Planctomycetota bacterium]